MADHGGVEKDESAFRDFHQQTARPLWAYVRRVVGSATEADDIVQEAFLRFLRAPPPIEATEERRAYLFRVASHLAADRWRRLARERRVVDAMPVPDPAGPCDRVSPIDLSSTFSRLRPRNRAVLWLAYVEGSTHREIADALGLGARSIRVLLFRARRRLKAPLAPGDPAPGAR